MFPSIDLRIALEGVTKHWSSRVVGRVKHQSVKAAKLLGQLTWHKHDEEDELFKVVRRRLHIQFESGVETLLEKGRFYGVPRGTLRNTVADEECFIVLIETVRTRHTGDVDTRRKRSIAEQLA